MSPQYTKVQYRSFFFFLSLNLFQDLESVSWILASPPDWTSFESPKKKTKKKIATQNRFLQLFQSPPTHAASEK